MRAAAGNHRSTAGARPPGEFRRCRKRATSAAETHTVTDQPPPLAKGFEPTQRWPVERTFGWLMQHRHLARDYETLPERSAAQINWAGHAPASSADVGLYT